MVFKHSDFILLIFNCEKYRWKAMKQKETWLKNFNLMPYYHVIGNAELTTDYLFDDSEKVLYVKTEDDYNSLPKKVILAYEAVNKEFVFKYIFKTDDDQNLTNHKFIETIQKLLLVNVPKIHYGGEIINVEQPYLSNYHTIHPELPEDLPVYATKYCSGRFYFLSDLAVQQLINKKISITNEYLEDYAIGYHMDEVLKKNMLNIQSSKYFIDF